MASVHCELSKYRLPSSISAARSLGFDCSRACSGAACLLSICACDGSGADGRLELLELELEEDELSGELPELCSKYPPRPPRISTTAIAVYTCVLVQLEVFAGWFFIGCFLPGAQCP